MHSASFAFRVAPFSDTPDLSMFWEGHGCQQIFNALLSGIADAEPLQTVIAEPGLGKTMLCRKLLNSLKSHKSRYQVIYLPYPHLCLEDTMNASLRSRPQTARRHTVLLIDEAQTLPDQALLTLLKASSAPYPDQHPIQLVLFAQPELTQRLQQPALRPLADLCTGAYRIEPFSREQVRAYLHERLMRAGADPDALISGGVVDAVCRASHGIPRLINTLMRKALAAAHDESADGLSRRHIELAAASTDAAVS